jgi:hypothetical protein
VSSATVGHGCGQPPGAVAMSMVERLGSVIVGSCPGWRPGHVRLHRAVEDRERPRRPGQRDRRAGRQIPHDVDVEAGGTHSELAGRVLAETQEPNGGIQPINGQVAVHWSVGSRWQDPAVAERDGVTSPSAEGSGRTRSSCRRAIALGGPEYVRTVARSRVRTTRSPGPTTSRKVPRSLEAWTGPSQVGRTPERIAIAPQAVCSAQRASGRLPAPPGAGRQTSRRRVLARDEGARHRPPSAGLDER